MQKNKYIVLFDKYLRGEISEQEKEQLISLLRNDEDIVRFFYHQLENADSELDENTTNRIYAHIRSKISSEKKSTALPLFWKKTMRWAAIFVLPILSVFGVYHFISNQKWYSENPVVITVPKGEKAEVTLADGSRVQINSASSLTYSRCFNRKERRVQLVGEAFFEVAQNKKRPFIVETTEMEIRAIGTAFNVRSYTEDSAVSVILVEGKVKVSTSDQETILSENQRATLYKSTRKLTTDVVRASDFTIWTNSSLYFDNQSFDEIAHTLSRVFDVEIRFVSDELRSIRFSGTLNVSNIRNALDILSLTSPMKYEMNGAVVELYYRK
ncbi:MAG: FecR domain-containing protein [Dysgonamonadaceae bacterium]|nr:FecR domain-containing protein [Dysgonamonadaceae bacterium]